MERAVVWEVYTSHTESTVTVDGLSTCSAALARVFAAVARLGVEPTTVAGSGAGVTLVVPRPRGQAVAASLAAAGTPVQLSNAVARVGVRGIGLRADSAVAATFCQAVVAAGVTLAAVSVESTDISVMCPEHRAEAAAGALAKTFGTVTHDIGRDLDPRRGPTLVVAGGGPL